MNKLDEILDLGQGDDKYIQELFNSFLKFRDGYYELEQYGKWWDGFNQSSTFDAVMSDAWDRIDGSNQLMDALDIMAAAMVGNYVRFDRFVKELNNESKNNTDKHND